MLCQIHLCEQPGISASQPVPLTQLQHHKIISKFSHAAIASTKMIRPCSSDSHTFAPGKFQYALSLANQLRDNTLAVSPSQLCLMVSKSVRCQQLAMLHLVFVSISFQGLGMSPSMKDSQAYWAMSKFLQYTNNERQHRMCMIADDTVLCALLALGYRL